MNERGARAEQRVQAHLETQGYRILATNVRLAGGELDIVARRGRQLLFCEVRMRSRSDYGDALETVDFFKSRRIRKAAQMWIARHPAARQLDVSLEVAAVRPDGIERVAFE
ncbi:MAG: YraN family protein [Gaiellaceae bacterium]